MGYIPITGTEAPHYAGARLSRRLTGIPGRGVAFLVLYIVCPMRRPFGPPHRVQEEEFHG